jgi:hypothetical protein
VGEALARREDLALSPLSAVNIGAEESPKTGDSPPVPPWLASHLVTFITLQTGSRARVQLLRRG